jgi:hypothetical protein
MARIQTPGHPNLEVPTMRRTIRRLLHTIGRSVRGRRRLAPTAVRNEDERYFDGVVPAIEGYPTGR